MIGLQQTCFTGLRQSSRAYSVKHLVILTIKPKQFPETQFRAFYSSLNHKNSSHKLCTASKSTLLQPHIGAFSLNRHPAIFRNYGTAQVSDKNGHLVYKGRLHGMFRGLKIFSLATSALGLLLQPYLWYTMQDVSLVVAVPLFTAINIFVFTNPFLIHFLSRRYINELYFNPGTKEFTATVLTFFARKEALTFTASDVHVPEMPGLFSMFTAKDHPLFVDERDFTSMEVYKHLMGFDRPLDLRHASNPNKQDEYN